MIKKFLGTFELFDFCVRRLSNGNKIRIKFEIAENLDIEKKLIEFRGKNVKTQIGIPLEKLETHYRMKVCLENVFEVFDIDVRRLRNGNKLSFVLETLYTKQIEEAVVPLRFQDCLVIMELENEELNFDEEEEGEEEENLPEIKFE